jgi:hypothetical protein
MIDPEEGEVKDLLRSRRCAVSARVFLLGPCVWLREAV